MLHKEQNNSVGDIIMLLLVFLNAFILKIAFIQNEKWYPALIITFPLLLITIYLNKKREQNSAT
jgi:predicted membrane protein